MSKAATKNPDRRREFVEVPLGDAAPLLERGAKAYKMGGCQIIVAEHGPGGWHLSISREGRLPSWEEVREARYALVPDEVTMAMILPPRAEYVNLHDYCFHLHQIEGETSG